MSMAPSRFLFRALYAAAVLVLIDQAAELLASLYPFEIGSVRWRFGAFGLIIGRTTTAVIVDALVLIAAVGLGHRAVLRVWGGLHFVVAVPLAAGLVMFLLDTLELRRSVIPDVAGTMVLASARAAVVVLAAVIYAIGAGIATFRAIKLIPEPRGETGSGSPLVMRESR